MKNYAHIFIAIAGLFSVGCFGQGVSANFKLETAFHSDTIPKEERVIVAYQVEERINMRFGSRVTTYTVPSLSMVNSYDLGPNNTRIIKPKYGKARRKPKASPMTLQAAGLSMDAAVADISSTKMPAVAMHFPEEKTAPKKETAYAYIDITSTYERILEKGYKSVDMFKRVANSRYFDGELTKAARWYKELFALTTDLEEAYYFRYAQSLKSINEHKKAAEIMAIFDSKVAQNP